jgi:tetratricopeptide (TPR) repeat protein
MVSSRLGAAVLALAAAALLTGCSDRKAEALFEDGARLAAQGRYEEAIATFRAVEQRYPRSQVAERAAREVELLHDLLVAGRRYKTDRALALVRETTRAIERFHADQGRWPLRLDELVPAWLERLEEDPWGRQVRYERTGKGYRVSCLGADGRSGGSNDDQDVVVENGEFLIVPEERDA